MSNWFYNIINGIITGSVILVFGAIFFDFMLYSHKEDVKKSKKSIVATGTMIGFYVVYYLVLRFNIGDFPWLSSGVWMIVIGAVIILFGAVINVIGRLQLKGNWANHIKIYKGHTLIQTGVYRLVRHPLYASIILMLFGGSLVYRNILSFLLTAFIFIPFMRYRAKQEETFLETEFPQYAEYKKRTGMFFPKLIRRRLTDV